MNVIYLLSYFKPLHVATDDSYSHFIFVNVFRLNFFSFFQIRLIYFRTCMAVIREKVMSEVLNLVVSDLLGLCSSNLGLEMDMSLFCTYFLRLWLNLLKCIMGNIRFSEPTSKLCIHSYLYIDYFSFSLKPRFWCLMTRLDSWLYFSLTVLPWEVIKPLWVCLCMWKGGI